MSMAYHPQTDGQTDDNPNTTQTLEYTKDKYNVSPTNNLQRPKDKVKKMRKGLKGK
jgi:hypothetical protein